jgi:hypothetical protein
VIRALEGDFGCAQEKTICRENDVSVVRHDYR